MQLGQFVIKGEIMGKKSFAAVCCLAALLLLSVAFIQDDSVQQRIRVRQRITDVVVKDDGGSFVAGLDVGDFRLSIDGKPVEIKAVTEYQTLTPDSEAITQYELKVEKARLEQKEPPPPPMPPRSIVFVFDRFNMGPQVQKEARDSMLQVVDEVLLPFDHVAIYELDRSVRMALSFTSNKDRVREAINELGGPSTNDHYRPSREDFFLPSNPLHLTGFRFHLQGKMADMRSYFGSLRGLAEALDAVPGRKTMIVYSEGLDTFNPASPEFIEQDIWFQPETRLIPVEPGEGTDGGNVKLVFAQNPSARAASKDELISELRSMGNWLRSELTQHYKSFENTLASSNITMITVRRGQQKPEWSGAASIDAINDFVQTQRNNFSVVNDRVRGMEMVRLESMREMARRTNGTFVDAGVSAQRLDDILAEKIGTYYELAFNIPPGWEQGFHEIEVTVPGKDVAVEQRSGMFARKPIEAMTDTERTDHLIDLVEAPTVNNELGLTAKAYPLPFKGRSTALVVCQLPNDSEHAFDGSELDFVLRVDDSSGKPLFHTHRRYNIDKEAADYFWTVENVPFMPSGSEITVAVQDNDTGRIGGVRNTVKVDDIPDEAVYVMDPMLLEATPAPGKLSEFPFDKIDDPVLIEQEVSYMKFPLPGMPARGNRIRQGENAQVMLLFGNIDNELAMTATSMEVKFIVRNEQQEDYILLHSNPKVQHVPQLQTLIYLAQVPLGISPTKGGTLRVWIEGIVEGSPMSVQIPYEITEFDKSKVEQFMEDGDIIKLKPSGEKE